MDREIEELRRLMLRSETNTASEEKLSRRNPAIAAGKKQQQQSSGADGQLQRTFWDPGGFQQSQEAHEQELIDFS
jgi:hypothetical protein